MIYLNGDNMEKDALLACDMDGTVIPHETGQKRKAEIKEFDRLINKHTNVVLAYVTGRHLELGLAGIEQYTLPFPDIFVCDVGTTIFVRSDNHWIVDEEYRGRLKEAWKGRTGADIAQMLIGIPGLLPQEEEKQKEFKQSYYISREISNEEISGRVHDCLGPEGVRVRVIYSIDSKKKIGLMDILPEIAAKDSALNYLRNKLELNEEKIVYAGDSGNDLLAFVSGYQAIIVNNTAEAVKKEVRRLARKKCIEQKIYFASAMYVQGVIEGSFHFRIFQE